MPAERCPTQGLERAAWFMREAAEWEDAGNLERAGYCRGIAAGIEERDFGARPLCVLMERREG